MLPFVTFTGCRWAEGPAYFPAGRYLGPRGELIRQLL